MSRELPIYRGAVPQAPQQQVVQVPQLAHVQGHGEAVDAALAGATRAVNRVIDWHDKGELTKADLEQRRIDTAKRIELADKMARSLDDPDGFGGADGKLDEGKVRAFISDWQQQNRMVGVDLLRGENQLEYEARLADVNSRIEQSVTLALADKELKERRQRFDDNLKLAREKEDWPGYERTLKDGKAGGQLSNAEYERQLLRMRNAQYESEQKGLMQRVQQAAAMGSQEFAGLYDDPHFYGLLSDENRFRVDQLAARLRGEVPQRKIREVQQDDGSMKLVAEAPEAPRGLSRGLVAIWNKHGGKFDSADAAEEARGELMVYLRGIVQHANDPAELEHAKGICRLYGHSDAFATQVVGQLRSEIDDSAVFNAREAMKAFTGKHRFLRAANTIKVQDLIARRDELLGRELDKKQRAELAMLEVQVKKWEGWSNSADEDAAREVFRKYDQWVLSHQGAGYKEQARAFYDFAYNLSLEDAVAGDADRTATEMTSIYETKLVEQLNKRRDAGEDLQADINATEKLRDDARKKAEAAEAAEDEAAKMQADKEAEEAGNSDMLNNARGAANGWRGNASEAILYVPKGHAMAGKVVSVATPDGAESYAEVVEQDGCEAPVLSQRLRVNLGVLNNPYSTISFDGSRGLLNNGEAASASARTAKSLGGLAPYYGAFMDAAVRNDIDPRLLMAIAMHETGRGSSTAFYRKRNAMGVSDANGPRSFKKVEDSIYLMARLLKKNYIDQGLTSIEQIGRKYAPIGAGNDPRGLNKHWVEGVTKYMQELTK